MATQTEIEEKLKNFDNKKSNNVSTIKITKNETNKKRNIGHTIYFNKEEKHIYCYQLPVELLKDGKIKNMTLATLIRYLLETEAKKYKLLNE